MYACAELQEEIPLVLRWRNHGPILRGWLAGSFGDPIASNPFDECEDAWHAWREGWFAANRGEEATYQPESWDDIPLD